MVMLLLLLLMMKMMKMTKMTKENLKRVSLLSQTWFLRTVLAAPARRSTSRGRTRRRTWKT